MAAKGVQALIEPNQRFKRTLSMIEHNFLKLRMAAIKRYMTYQSAEHMLNEVTSRIPNSPQYAAYKNALRIVQSGEMRNPIFAVYAESDAKPVEVDTEILTIRPKRRNGRIDPMVALLIEFQPWTVRTLPFDVSDKVATLVSRKVTRREVEQIERDREKDGPQIAQRLRELGIQATKRKTTIPAEVTAIPDLYYTALRLEYGLGGTQASAHWRPAVRTTTAYAKKLFLDSELDEVLLDWKNTEWKKWRRLRSEQEPTKKIAALKKFQGKISK